MKNVFLIYFIVGCSLYATSQSEEKTERRFQVNLDATELLYYFPRIGIGIEQKFIRNSLWASFHFGSDEFGIHLKPRFYNRDYKYVGFEAGFKRFYSAGSGEFFWGSQLQLDKTQAEVTDDVYYDIPKKEAVLFDEAKYQRFRIGLFIDHGYVFYLGQRFTLEVAGGVGIRGIKKWYTDIKNPFELEQVEPAKFRDKFDYKFVRTEFRPAIVGSLKLGYRLF